MEFRSDKYLWVVRLVVALIAAGFAAVAGLASVVAYRVYYGSDEQLKKSAILARINEETSIFFLDEKTQIGSFFGTQHRRYVPIDEIPAHLINAIIAAEDKNFFDHPGIDVAAIAKAYGEALAQGHLLPRRGGSTITQQTVKNITGKWEHSIQRKFNEWIMALQLERLYSKRQILEFYLNQFHVAANGNGIGIAAQYYFNKEVRDLTLVEAAFIAGSVKGPSKYNPFIKFTKKTRAKAEEFANERKDYVLGRMQEQGWLSDSEYKEATAAKIPFNRGKFRTSQVSLLELVRKEMSKKEILDALNISDAEELSSAGLKIYTTIDDSMQKKAQLSVRRNLSRIETILTGFKPAAQEDYQLLRYLEKEKFYYGKVEEVVKGSTPQIKVSFGLPVGVINSENLEAFAKNLDMPYMKGVKKQVTEILDRLKPGDVLFVEVLDIDESTHVANLALHVSPEVSGGLIAVDKGEIRAVVGGFDTIGFDRAMDARRMPGSVFKCVVYYAALQLGWSMLDFLDNDRQLFPFQGQFYYPRPDHPSPYRETSMIWAGIKSENLASVSLAARLLEKLNFEQFKFLMGKLGLLPLDSEAPSDYHFRVAKETGVQLDNQGVKEYQLSNAVQDVAPDLIFAGKDRLLHRIRQMWWGKGYLPELHAILARMDEERQPRETLLRLRLVRNNFVRSGLVAKQLSADWSALSEAFGGRGLETGLKDAKILAILGRFRVLPSVGKTPSLGYYFTPDDEAKVEATIAASSELSAIARPEGRELNPLDAQAIWAGDGFGEQGESEGASLSNVLIDGFLPLGTFLKLSQQLDERYEAVMSKVDRYELPRYFEHHDFRIILGLKYLQSLGASMGVESKLEPVLSFPLGSNDVSAAEVAKIYQTFVSGKTYRFYKEGPQNQLTAIRRIEDRQGKVLYTAERKENTLARIEYSLQMHEILRKVFTHGTGNLALEDLVLKVKRTGDLSPEAASAKGDEVKVQIPAYGKTGTTNDFTTSYFAGFLPFPTEKGKALELDNSLVIAAYAGYDLNRIMRNGGVRIYGSTGALPMWSDFAKQVINDVGYADKIDQLDISMITSKKMPIAGENATTPVVVDLPRGLVVGAGGANWDAAEVGNGADGSDFALGNSVKSILKVPTERTQQGWQPLRKFGPFVKENEGQRRDGDTLGDLASVSGEDNRVHRADYGGVESDVDEPGAKAKSVIADEAQPKPSEVKKLADPVVPSGAPTAKAPAAERPPEKVLPWMRPEKSQAEGQKDREQSGAENSSGEGKSPVSKAVPPNQDNKADSRGNADLDDSQPIPTKAGKEDDELW